MEYRKEDIIVKCYEAIEDVTTFYNREFINYRGRTTDTKDLYTEVVAEFICGNLKAFQNITSNTRKSSYQVEAHNGV